MGQGILRGRSDELGTILGSIRRAARAGTGALVVVSGEPGIGKTRLLRAVAEEATRSGCTVGVGSAEEIDQIAPGVPLLLALRSGPRPVVDGADFEGLAALYDQQLWLVERISGMLKDAAKRTPVVIAIDDVHWADRLTRFALRILPGRLAEFPVIWVLTSRLAPADVVEELTTAVADAVTVTRVRLGPLAPEDIEGLAEDRLGAPPSDAVRNLLRGAGGNPFWAVQVLDGLAWRQAHGLTHDDMHAEFIDDVRRRLALLAPETVALVRLAAVWGRNLSIEDAARLGGNLPAARVLYAARQAADYGLLTSGQEGIDFAHALVRDAVYADIEPHERDALHRACGRYLVHTRSEALAAAPHFRAVAQSGDEEAARVLLQAAMESASTAPDQAAELAQEAFGLLPPQHGRWLAVGEQVVALLVRVQREAAVLAIAGRLIAETDDNNVAARLQVQACRALWAAGACHEIERRVDLSLRVDGVAPAVRAQLAAMRVLASTRTESAPQAAEAAEDVLATGRRLGDEVTLRIALLAHAEVARSEGRHQLALDRFAELRSVTPSEHLADEIRALQHLDRYDEADRLLAKVRDEARDDINTILPSILYAQIWQDHNLARFDAAEAGARALLRLAREIGNFGHEIDARMVLAAVAVYRGEPDEAFTTLEPAVARVEFRDELRISRLRLMQGWLAGAQGHLEPSLAILRPLLSAAAAGNGSWCWSPPWMRTLAGIGVAASDIGFARAAASIAELGAERNPGVETMAGVALQLRGFVEQDAQLLEQAVEVLRRGPRPLILAQALADHATVLRAGGETAAADVRMGEALASFAALGVAPGALGGTFTERVAPAVRKRAAGARRATQGIDSLTESEWRVASLVSAGRSSRQVAEELGVSLNTVNTHLRSSFVKLGVRSRVQLSNLLREQRPDRRQP